MGVGISLVRRGCLLIRRTQCPHQQACRFVAYLIHIPGRPDQRAMTKAEETGHHDINIGFQFTRRDIRSDEGSELADATDRKSTRLKPSHSCASSMPSAA